MAVLYMAHVYVFSIHLKRANRFYRSFDVVKLNTQLVPIVSTKFKIHLKIGFHCKIQMISFNIRSFEKIQPHVHQFANAYFKDISTLFFSLFFYLYLLLTIYIQIPGFVVHLDNDVVGFDKLNFVHTWNELE